MGRENQLFIRDNAKQPQVTQQRRVPTLKQIKTFAQAVFFGTYASPEVVAQRMAICQRCDMRRVTLGGVEWCGVCGCKVSRKDREIDNVAAYEENLPSWGCKHPLRRQGRGGPMALTASAKAELQHPVVDSKRANPIAEVVVHGKYTSARTVTLRIQICRECDEHSVTPIGTEWCNISGCRVSPQDRQIDNLAAYEENLPKWGCKHALRSQGKGWPRSGEMKS